RAFVTIIDSNITTLIAGVLLYQFGTGPVRGFAVTLCIGILANIFTAVYFTRWMFDFYTLKTSVKQLSI
ncbi:MAG: protein translocase subunit SecD, partial [Desulfobacterales bacterium]|nr:protein translocase subunit SecD [Desulfobacterales bacterium]